MGEFWLRCEDWLAARGYTLHARRPPGPRTLKGLWYPPEYTAPASLPYAGRASVENPLPYPLVPALRVAWAQDSRNRDVVIKLTNKDIDEYRIYSTLLHCGELQVPGKCMGVLAPVAILDTPYNYSFVIMPMWGGLESLIDFDNVAQVMRFMRCTLQGLAVLHAHRIAHRDIHQSNMLVDCYSQELEVAGMGPAHAEHRRTKEASYCLYDFNLSIQLPPDTSLRDCRRPAQEAMTTESSIQPQDIILGEHVYNPFAFDVGCLGNLFRVHFWRAVSIVPWFAPLFDRMTTHVISQRFTAEDALAFLDHIATHLPKDACDASMTLEPDWYTCEERGIYWDLTPPGFTTFWSHYKTPLHGRLAHVIDRLCSCQFGWRAVRYIRALLRR
ncbi:hypothetical protein OH77DRAFT_1424609 [Trametes cingulata]|nr:hypothetical protein OH77DRAFT_1424609 [Trametes cingulata]